VGEPDADAIATAALACAGVVGLHGGPRNEFAAYLPGRTVAGVRLADDHVEVHVVARYGSALQPLADEVRTAVTPLSGGLPVEIHIDDIDIDRGGTIDVTEPARA
jgi:uncharacterized alkaline shock family protein YloU